MAWGFFFRWAYRLSHSDLGGAGSGAKSGASATSFMMLGWLEISVYATQHLVDLPHCH